MPRHNPTYFTAEGEWREMTEHEWRDDEGTSGLPEPSTSRRGGQARPKSRTVPPTRIATRLRGLWPTKKAVTSEAAGGKDFITAQGIWTGEEEALGPAELLAFRAGMEDIHDRRESRRAQREARKLIGHQQKWIFLGVLGLLGVVIGVLVFGQAAKMSEAFALELMRSTVPVLVGAIAGVLGFLFGSGNNTKP